MQAIIEKGLPMRDVTVERVNLLEILRKNREVHIADYKEACAGYKNAALERIDEIAGEMKGYINRLKEGQVVEIMAIRFGLDAPKSYEDVYDQAIRMMELEVADTVKLRSDEFACYVMDDWDWKDSFTTTTQSYSRVK